MSDLSYRKPDVLSLENDSRFDEAWLRDKIVEDPSILGLGDLVVKDKERFQAGAGRLDLLLQEDDPEAPRRYEVEIQLGATDESHIIRTIEYWDLERKRYPHYEHCAVIIAEDITSRFFNVIDLFNGFIPLIAVKLQAVQVDNSIGLLSTKVLDERSFGFLEEEEEESISVGRDYWEAKRPEETVRIADLVEETITDFAPEYSLNYNQQYIGVKRGNTPNNFVKIKPWKSYAVLKLRMEQTDPRTTRIDDAGIEQMAYRNGKYRLRLYPGDFEENERLLAELLREAYSETG